MDTKIVQDLTELWTLFVRLDREKESEGGFFHQLVLWPDSSGHIDYALIGRVSWDNLAEAKDVLTAYLASPQYRGVRTYERPASADQLLAAWPVFQEYVKTLPQEWTADEPSQADPPGLIFCSDGSGQLLYGPLALWGEKQSAADALRALWPKPAMLQPKEETTYVLTDREVDTLMWTHLGLDDYSVIADQEWDNSESHLIEIAPEKYDQDKREMVAEVLSGKQDTMFKLRSLMAELASRGHIPWGVYRIDINW